MSGSALIREANADDALAMIRCRTSDPSAEPGDPRIVDYLKGQHHPQQALPSRAGFVAIENGSVVGYIAGHLTTRHGCAGELQYLFVASSHRRRGIGTELNRHLARWFYFNNASDVCVALAADSPKEARPFMEFLGATPLKANWYHWEDIEKVFSNHVDS